MARQTDEEALRARWFGPFADGLLPSLDRCFSRDSDFSADDLAQILSQTSEPHAWVRGLCAEARRRGQAGTAENPEEAFALSRILHTLGSGLLKWLDTPARAEGEPLFGSLPTELLEWLRQQRLDPVETPDLRAWAHRAREAAFDALRRTIVASGDKAHGPVRNSLRTD